MGRFTGKLPHGGGGGGGGKWRRWFRSRFGKTFSIPLHLHLFKTRQGDPGLQVGEQSCRGFYFYFASCEVSLTIGLP